MKSTLQHIAILFLLMSAFLTVKAATYTWNGSTSTSWAVAANWTPTRTTPATTDDIVITPTGDLTITGIPVQTINSLTVNGTGTNTVTYSGAVTTLTIAASGSVNIAAGNTLNVGLMRITGTAGSFTTSGTGTLITATNGSVLPAGTSTTYVTYTFDLILNGASNQTLSAYANYNNVTINLQTSSLKALLGSSITVNGTLTLTKGIIDINTKTMTMGSTANITGASSNSYIYTNGTFIRNGVSSSATLFPIGTATSYTPLTLTNTTGAPNITATVKSTITNAPFDATKVVNLEWYVKSSATSTADITYQFNTADFAASYNVSSASEVGIYKTSYTNISVGTASGSNPYTLSTTAVGLSTTAIYNVIGNIGAVRAVNYTWTGATSTDYAVSTNWSPNRNGSSTLDNLTITPTTATSITNVQTQTINSLTVNGTGTNTVTLSGGTNTLTFQSGGSINIAAGNTLDMGTVRIALSDVTTGTLTTTGTGGLITAATTPLPSTASGTGVTFTFDVTLNGTAVQSIPRSVFNNLTINNTTSGIAAGIGGGDCTVNGTLNLTRGILCCAGTTGVGTTRNLFLGSAATIIGGSSASWVYPAGGTFVRKGVGTTPLLYPLGTLSSYTPLTINNNSGTPNITTKLKSAITNAVFDATKVVNLEWSVLSSVATTADITYQFNTADFASGYSVGSASELGNYKTSYTTSNSGIVSGSNPYTLTADGLSIPSAGSNFYVIGNTNGIVLNVSANSNLSSYSPTSATDVKVSAGYELTVNSDVTVKTITVAPGAKLTLTSGTLTATNGITLQSDATGTATILNSGTYTGTITAEQYLGSARNWYVSSPVTNTTSPATNITRYYEYVEAGNNADFSVTGSTAYWKGLNTGSSMNVGKGYIAQASAGTTVQFSGTPNNGNITTSFNLTRDDAKGKGFNLVGNPYPSYIDWSLVAQANPNLISTAWFKTKKTDVAGGGYTFASVNVTTPSSPEIVANNANTTITKYIPPTQAFWVRVKSGTSSTSMSFTNAMREHRLSSGDLMKAPKVNERSRLRLQLVNGIESDETLIYFDKIATNDFNEYDSPKMMNNSDVTPDLYTKAGVERLVINGMNAIANNMELPLGFSLNAAASLKLKATEMSNFPLGTSVYLLDKVESSQVELLPETEYNFETTTVTTYNESRFSLLFRAPGYITGMDKSENDFEQVFVNAAKQIIIIAKPKSKYAIYNAVGQMIENGILNTECESPNKKLDAGVYIVKVNNNSTRVIIK